MLFLPPGERHKRMSQVERLTTEMTKAGADRSSLLIAFGGGVTGDVGGFVSAIYMRGIDYIQVPTTLLSQVDSSVGGKTGVNLQTGKNLVGCFYPPQAVIADIGAAAHAAATGVARRHVRKHQGWADSRCGAVPLH